MILTEKILSLTHAELPCWSPHGARRSEATWHDNYYEADCNNWFVTKAGCPLTTNRKTFWTPTAAQRSQNFNMRYFTSIILYYHFKLWPSLYSEATNCFCHKMLLVRIIQNPMLKSLTQASKYPNLNFRRCNLFLRKTFHTLETSRAVRKTSGY